MLIPPNRTWRRRYAARGAAFTLIEVLVVVAILGILTGLLMGVMGGMREKAREADTASRLRQVFMLQGSYAQDHGGRMTPFYGNDDAGTNLTTWQEVLLPYLNKAVVAGAKEDPRLVLNSPYQVRKEGLPFWSQGRSFGLNNFMAHANWRYYQARVPQPSKVVLAGDMVQGNVDFMNTSDGANWYSGGGITWGLPAYRHHNDKKAMFVFCDGHVDLLGTDDLRANPVGGRASVWKWW